MITIAYLKQLIKEHPINFKRLCDDANVSLNSVYQKIFYKNRALKPYEEERLREGLINMRRYLEEGTMSKIEIDAEKIKAEQAYLRAEGIIKEIKIKQQNIEKLIAEIRELALGFNPNKILEKK